MRTRKNHYALKTHLYLSALQQAFQALSQLEPVSQLRNMRFLICSKGMDTPKSGAPARFGAGTTLCYSLECRVLR